jgi:hypothetical protein
MTEGSSAELPFTRAHYLLYTRWVSTTPKGHAMIFEYLIQLSRPSSDDSINFPASLVVHRPF